MKLTSQSLTDSAPIARRFAFCQADPTSHVSLADNISPHLAWDEIPQGTRSFALICHDPDVPSRADDVNQEGRQVPADLPRVDFFHWVLVDIPADCRELAEGADSSEITPRGKSPRGGPAGSRRGLNNYTDWFSSDAEMEGQYFGYDGPCPPWNDSIPHHYHFTLYALDIEHCPVEGNFGGPEVREAIKGHILAEARLTCTYSMNPEVPA
ncbi:YbhB/YbcL family Raf kinase inhibitor-like protein [endosymbiont of Ridgeia piscesae]|jgi:Raf kinase inhibitor-like YbhB/YbcL family protein|uniref:Phospholipid-binding protein, PBP family n=1 Tax=endosymbiont of Ridgeia piscesae TaxID=54398 RepID=A0A0T5ZA72_9GAMM|nr:YbhB/YbcL family Raf kinase inhibitor-like protein [endosymbiont of Ridgeia piscesae]KRT54276.1 phospholipid-binding protein, PBP family [endosymbiont of Ridgeia piscesae]KRT59753.1 phospholipid-binding protein, PBP family [endosymbiont of Ridgeia piscesae]